MAERSYTSQDTDVTVFVTSDSYIIGVGETIDEVSASGKWLLTRDPVDVRR